jgi:GNAT superfamily N-acetyltransferase
VTVTETLRPPAGAAPWSTRLTTRSGLTFDVRPAHREDEVALADCFAHVAPEDLQFRFLTACRDIGHDRLVAMTDIDHDRTEHFLAVLPDGTIIASALVVIATDGTRAEVAVAIRADYRHRGIGWTLLDHVAHYAEARGVTLLESYESSENRAAIALEREMGFVAERVPGDPTMVRVSRRF